MHAHGYSFVYTGARESNSKTDSYELRRTEVCVWRSIVTELILNGNFVPSLSQLNILKVSQLYKLNTNILILKICVQTWLT